MSLWAWLTPPTQVHPEGKYVVDLDKAIEMKDVQPNCRVALKNDSYKLHKILPNKVSSTKVPLSPSSGDTLCLFKSQCYVTMCLLWWCVHSFCCVLKLQREVNFVVNELLPSIV